ncbi:hypothetical protein [Lactobacillus phage Semele]|uniref:Uncharacterized protein n=1 Tax=Lactobacillus phage Semele TaxID=2079433 RepID=A0A2K9VDA9_9CAUD|nr:hypothetical protein HOS80_gp118 [Lactobacillus phage Semele]AUV60144.1 hypothetical protein [Lactobacillus phage Semele]
MGYTDGVAKAMSEASAQGKLFLIDSFTYKDSNYNSDDLDSEALSDFLDQKLDLDSTDCVELLRDGYTYDSEGNEIELVENKDGFTVDAFQSALDFIDDNSQGGLYYIFDGAKELLGAKMGVCGEHIGSVSVWLDTTTSQATLTQGNEVYHLTSEDTNDINEALNTLFYD